MAQLIVIVGAGASYDCASPRVDREESLRPPLVGQLFDGHGEGRREFAEILHAYPRAEAAAADIRPSIASTTAAISLERYLRERMHEASNPYARLRYEAVPLYFQHLLFRVGQTEGIITERGFTRHPDNYDRLVSAALELDDIVFVTLNYDVLLDRRLFLYERQTGMESYTSPSRPWSLIKLHGSVDWGREVQGHYVARPGSQATLSEEFARITDLETRLSESIELRAGRTLAMMRWEPSERSAGSTGTLYYPAIALPLGSEDELVCPPEHVQFLRGKLTEQDGLHVLVVGYSGLDNAVLDLFKESGNGLRTLLVVNPVQRGAEEAAQRVAQSLQQGSGFRRDWLAVEKFTDFAQGDDLKRFLDGLR